MLKMGVLSQPFCREKLCGKRLSLFFFWLPSHVLECQIDGCCLIVTRVQGGLGGKSNMPLMPMVRGKAKAEGLAGSPTPVLISD